MAKKRKPSATVLEYRKQRKRVQNLISRYRRQGFIVDYEVPDIPKRITKSSVNRLAKITSKEVQKKTRGVSEEGEILSFKKARNQLLKARKENRNVSYEYDFSLETSAPGSAPVGEVASGATVVISNFRAHIGGFNEEFVDMMNGWLNALIQQEGEEAVANMLLEADAHGVLPTHEIRYKVENIKAYMAELLDFMDLTAQGRADMIDAIESGESMETY